MDSPSLVHFAFCGFDVGAGAIAEFRDRLATAERSLERGFGLRGRDLGKRLGITSIGGFRTNAARHGLGRAIDVNYSASPYIATRTPKVGGGFVYGGEAAGAHLTGVREAAMAACDRAMASTHAWASVHGGGVSRFTAADLAARRSGESTGSVWDRFQRVSMAWQAYFCVVFVDSPYVQRPPGVPPLPTELVPLDTSLAMITHNGVPPPTGIDAAAFRTQIIADFDAVRIPTVVGAPSAKPSKTRNPVRGFLPFGRDLAVALCDAAGMRWGACDFGPQESGDMMHFDR